MPWLLLVGVLVVGVSVLSSMKWEPPTTARPFLPDIYAAEKLYRLPENLLARLLYQESRYRPDIVDGTTRSPVGAIGIAQFMPATAAEWGVNPLDPVSSIYGAAKYMRWLYDRTGSWHLALAAYNWGIGNVERKGFAQAPSETVAYVSEITGDVEGV